jgi:hypothetical protein
MIVQKGVLMYNKKMYLVVGIVVVLFAMGCVSKSEFEQVENELNVTQGQLETTQGQLEVLQAQYNLLEEQHTVLQLEQGALDSAHAALEIDYAALEESLAALTINHDSLQSEHERTLNHLTMVQAQVEDLRRILEREQDVLAGIEQQILHASAMIDFVIMIELPYWTGESEAWSDSEAFRYFMSLDDCIKEIDDPVMTRKFRDMMDSDDEAMTNEFWLYFYESLRDCFDSLRSYDFDDLVGG